MAKTKRLTKKAKKALTPATLHLADELQPRIGSGVRRVLVKKKTPSFVWLYYNDQPMKISRKVYDTVVVEEAE